MRGIARGFGLGMLALLVSACGFLRDEPPTVTPIYVTATPNLPVIPIVATETPGATSVIGPTDASFLPTQPATRTPTPPPAGPITLTPSFTPSPTDTPATPGNVFYAPVGNAPGSAGAAGSAACSTAAAGGFGALFQNDAALQASIGCPLAGGTASAVSAYQPFQNGVMIWLSSLGVGSQPVIYALYNNGTYQRFNDTWREGIDPSNMGASPPPGLIEPVRGFGKVWRENPNASSALGWATAGEAPGSGQVQLFERGEMVYVSQAGQIYILITGAPGTWSARAGTP